MTASEWEGGTCFEDSSEDVDTGSTALNLLRDCVIFATLKNKTTTATVRIPTAIARTLASATRSDWVAVVEEEDADADADAEEDPEGDLKSKLTDEKLKSFFKRKCRIVYYFGKVWTRSR